MKNNSFKFNGPFPKKLVLTALLATVLSGPYVYQISSKDFSTSEFASTASELSAAEKLKIDYEVDLKLALERLKKSDPVKYKDITALPSSGEITDPALKAVVAAVEAKKTVLDTRSAEAEKEKLVKEAEQKRKDEIEAAEKAAKEKKEKAAEAKEKDCTDKDKTASERRTCREDAKLKEKEDKAEAASKKFEVRLEKAMDRCDKISSAKSKDAYEDKELACKSKAFMDALKSGNRDLSAADVNAKFRHFLANQEEGIDLFSMLYSDDERDAERASIILSNLFSGKTQYPGLKRMIMDEVRRKADAPAKKVAAEFRKANQLPQNSTERTAQFTAAVAAKSELESKIEVYSSSMMYPLQKVGDRDALAYYHSSYTKGIESLLLKAMTGSSTIGGAVGGATRGGAARGGSASTTTEAALTRGADGKVTQSGGTLYELLQPGTIENIRFGTPSSTRTSEQRVGNRISK